MQNYETAEETRAKAERLAEIEQLLAAGMENREERAFLMQERLWYANGHPFHSWKEFQAEMAAGKAMRDKEAAEEAKAEAERKAEVEKLAAERDTEQRAEFEAERDAFLQWKRSKAARTF